MCLLYIYTHNYNNDEQWTNITILSTTATVHNNSDDKHINHKVKVTGGFKLLRLNLLSDLYQNLNVV